MHTAIQVALKWVLQLGHALTTSTVNPAYMKQDLEALQSAWRISEEDMSEIDQLNVAPDDPVKSMCLFS